MREGTITANIGFWMRASGRHRARDSEAAESVRRWAVHENIDAVIWTDLASNFRQQMGYDFSVLSAVKYLENLDGQAKEIALTYIRRAPAFIQTPLRNVFGRGAGCVL
jgi:hypothetical protein